MSNGNGTNASQLTHDTGAADRMPTWSPDGKMIAFASNLSGSWQVTEISVSGTGETRITSGATNNQPNWCCSQAP